MPGILAGQDIPIAAASLLIPDGTPVKLRLSQTISSAHAHVGDRLRFQVSNDVVEKGYTVIPAGSTAVGTVLAVKGKRFLGMGGKVVLNLDSVELVNGERVGLQAQQIVKGQSHTKRMAAEMLSTCIFFWPAAPVFLFSRGEDSTALKGIEVTAHIDGNIRLREAGLQSAGNSQPQKISDVMGFVPPRVLNREGREGDMVNLMFVAQPDDLQAAFRRGGWVKVDKWRPVMAWHLLRHRTHDSTLPMARFYLFGRVQDYAYALPDPQAVVSRRHHLRIWKTDYAVDGSPLWAAAATHDIAIELVKHGRLINHRIDPNVDEERDFVGENLASTLLVDHQQYLSGADPVYSAQTAAGENYYSDSRILRLDLHNAADDIHDQAGEASVLRGWTMPTLSSMSLLAPRY